MYMAGTRSEVWKFQPMGPALLIVTQSCLQAVCIPTGTVSVLYVSLIIKLKTSPKHSQIFYS